eukprot:6212966-Pleurochrysis_carterae.AAC.1
MRSSTSIDAQRVSAVLAASIRTCARRACARAAASHLATSLLSSAETDSSIGPYRTDCLGPSFTQQFASCYERRACSPTRRSIIASHRR